MVEGSFEEVCFEGFLEGGECGGDSDVVRSEFQRVRAAMEKGCPPRSGH